MARLLIDGYNLIGTLHKDLEAARRRLLHALIGYNKDRGHEITVIFDGWREGGPKEEHSVQGGIRIIYSRLAEKADTAIKRILRERTGQDYILVTSDRELAGSAWASGAVPVRSEDFLRKLSGRGDISEEFFEAEEEERPARKAAKTSRKEKAIERALKRL